MRVLVIVKGETQGVRIRLAAKPGDFTEMGKFNAELGRTA